MVKQYKLKASGKRTATADIPDFGMCYHREVRPVCLLNGDDYKPKFEMHGFQKVHLDTCLSQRTFRSMIASGTGYPLSVAFGKPTYYKDTNNEICKDTLKQVCRQYTAAVRKACPDVKAVVLDHWVLRDGKTKGYAATAHTDWSRRIAANKMGWVRRNKLMLILKDAVACAKRGHPEDAVDVGLAMKIVSRELPDDVHELFKMLSQKNRRRVFFGTWQNVHEMQQPVLNNHLAFLLRNPGDEQHLRLICQDTSDERYHLKRAPSDPSARHRWVYFPELEVTEALVWKHSDSNLYEEDAKVGGAVFHSSIDTADAWKQKGILQDKAPQSYVRQSVEARLVGFF